MRRTWNPGVSVSTIKQVTRRALGLALFARIRVHSLRDQRPDPEFAAIDDPVVAILNGSGLNGSGWV